ADVGLAPARAAGVRGSIGLVPLSVERARPDQARARAVDHAELEREAEGVAGGDHVSVPAVLAALGKALLRAQRDAFVRAEARKVRGRRVAFVAPLAHLHAEQREATRVGDDEPVARGLARHARAAL